MAARQPLTKARNIPEDAPLADVDHFSSLPIAQAVLNDPSFSIFSMSRLSVRHSERHHTLMTQTWNTPDTLPHTLTFTKSVPSGPPEVCRFWSFGSGLNAHTEQLHGGVQAALLDSTLSFAAFTAVQQISRDERMTVATVQLNIRYQKPVPTPGTVMITAKVDRTENGGRKIWVSGSMKGGENGEVGHATVEGMWLRIRTPGERL